MLNPPAKHHATSISLHDAVRHCARDESDGRQATVAKLAVHVQRLTVGRCDVKSVDFGSGSAKENDFV